MKINLILIALVAVLLAGCSGAASGLSVTGRGQVSLAPDIAYVTIGVHSEGDDISEVITQNSEQVASVLAALAELGVPAGDIQTSNFSVYTGDRYDPVIGQSLGRFHTVDNTVRVTIRELAAMGALLDSVVAAGANSIWDVYFDLEDKAAVLAEARDLAVADAVAEAQSLSEAAGLTLGEIRNLSYVETNYYYPPYYGEGGGAGDASTRILSGLITLSAEVHITYDIP